MLSLSHRPKISYMNDSCFFKARRCFSMLVCVFCCCWKLEKNPTKITFFPAPAETAKHQGSLWSAWRLRCGRTSPDPCATTRIGIPKCSRRCCTAREPGKFFGQFLGVFGIWLKGKKRSHIQRIGILTKCMLHDSDGVVLFEMDCW